MLHVFKIAVPNPQEVAEAMRSAAAILAESKSANLKVAGVVAQVADALEWQLPEPEPKGVGAFVKALCRYPRGEMPTNIPHIHVRVNLREDAPNAWYCSWRSERISWERIDTPDKLGDGVSVPL